MENFQLFRDLHRKSNSKIILLVLDGVGGLPIEPGGPTELSAANTPHLDRMASEGALGQTIPIRRGITPGSGPAHLALFGYDPLKYVVGRGVLEASGIGMKISKGDVAARSNFCTVDNEGRIVDRRAGRISSTDAIPIVEELADIRLPEVETEVRHLREYRFAVVMRGDRLDSNLDDTDPQQVGVPPKAVHAIDPAAQKTADLFNQWILAARECLSDQPKANAITLRGFSTDPGLPQFPEIFGLRSACISVYPMYRGVSRLVGMQVVEFQGELPEEEFQTVAQAWSDFDFFFIHIKKPDSKGEDGDFEGKVRVIESVDSAMPILLELDPEVMVVTGDHSTPARLRTHSWHPVPTMLWAPATVRPDSETVFSEKNSVHGGLGTFPAIELMQIMMAHAQRFDKFGA